MRLIDADRLKEVFRRNTGCDYSEFIDIQPTVDVLEQITAEIRHIVDEETEHDEKWARGLHYSLCIIDKHMKGDTE